DLGDAEVAAAEAAIVHAPVPELSEPAVPPVPEVEAAAESVPELAAGNGTAEVGDVATSGEGADVLATPASSAAPAASAAGTTGAKSTRAK
ncbi:MAG TPA: hypothetical protein VF482_04560, partial [Trebonia sp.]